MLEESKSTLPKKLNVGCGFNKISGYINIDSEKCVSPDLVLDITIKRLPFSNNSIGEILFFHCIEHIQKEKHYEIIKEFSRVLKLGGKLYISYPEFWECAKRWRANLGGKRNFWEATLFGRQLHTGDFHVCAMDSSELRVLLFECGFTDVVTKPEKLEEYYSVTRAIKTGELAPNYETLVKEDTKAMIVKVGGQK